MVAILSQTTTVTSSICCNFNRYFFFLKEISLLPVCFSFGRLFLMRVMDIPYLNLEGPDCKYIDFLIASVVTRVWPERDTREMVLTRELFP